MTVGIREEQVRDVMLKRFFHRSANQKDANQVPADDGIVELTGRSVHRKVVPVIGASILELAEKNKVDWNSNCRRGTCARCRCYVSEGMEFLSEPNAAERARLEEEEIVQGFRLGCQATITGEGPLKVKHSPYF